MKSHCTWMSLSPPLFAVTNVCTPASSLTKFMGEHTHECSHTRLQVMVLFFSGYLPFRHGDGMQVVLLSLLRNVCRLRCGVKGTTIQQGFQGSQSQRCRGCPRLVSLRSHVEVKEVVNKQSSSLKKKRKFLINIQVHSWRPLESLNGSLVFGSSFGLSDAIGEGLCAETHRML